MRVRYGHNNKHYTIVLLLGMSVLWGSWKSIPGKLTDVRTVVIDAGHGGKDPGCSGIKHKEKDIALAVALKLGHYIEQNCKDVKVVYTRKTDVFVELQERAAIANRNNADLFICIHCNANPNKSAHGSETYVMGLNKTRGNLDVAKRENAAILLEDNYKQNYDGFDPNSDEANIIFNFYQNKYLEQSLNLASKIQKNYKEKAQRYDKGVRQAGFLVLWKTAMPSLLTETGFLTNVEEEQFLGSEKGQDYLALSIFKAFREYKDEMEGRKSKYEDTIENTPPYEAPKKEVEVMEHKEEAKESVRTVEPDKKEEAIIADKEELKQLTDNTVYYGVQFLVTDKKIEKDSEQLNGLENITEFSDNGIYKYATGAYTNIDQASKLQSEVRKKGFTDAFLIAYKNGIRISLDEAKRSK